MTNRLMRGFGRKREDSERPDDRSSSPSTPAAPDPAGSAGPEVRSALELAQALLRGLEHFVLSTADLDAPSFLDRLRRMAARLTSSVAIDELQDQRQWASDSLAAFGQLQRRYLSEREDELWRLLNLYQEHLKVDGAANNQFHDSLRAAHDRMGQVVRLDDLRQVRERLESEIARAGTILEQKSQVDEERAAMLSAQVRQLEAQLIAARQEANRDPLTGVLNRSGFNAELAAAIQSPNRVALAILDVDNFKGVNDTLGHLVGDQILRIAVQVLAKIARPGDVIGRYGGDEFCLMAPGVAPERLADRFTASLIQQNVTFQYEEKLWAVRLSLSVGVAGAVPNDTLESLFQRADTALLESKRGGKGHARVAPTPVTAG